MIVAFVDEMRTEGYAVESVCRVLREQGCQVAARGPTGTGYSLTGQSRLVP